MIQTARGFSTFLVVGLLLSISIPLSMVAMLLSIDGGQADIAAKRGYAALLVAEGCAEDVLLRLRTDPAYSGSSISLPEGDCSVSIAENGNDRTILVTAEREGYEKTVEVGVTVAPTGILLQTWIEQPL